MNLSNFGEQFASKVLAKFYQASVMGGITNRDYEGEIKKAGDRVNILSFLNAGELGDYVVGTDMTVAQIVDAEDQLIVEKRKYYNFSLDRLEDLFTYADNIPDTMILEHSKVLERVTDAYILDKFGSETKAGSWIGVNFLVVGAANTMASLVTSATGGTITIVEESTVNSGLTTIVENPLDGNNYFGGFENSMLYKGIRLVSTRAIVSPWWRISGVTDSNTVTVTEWDEATSGPDFAENYTLRGIFGGDGTTFPKYTDAAGNDVSAWVAGNSGSGFGWEVQAAIATSVTSSSVYNQVTLLGQALDENEVPGESRHITFTPAVITQLKQSSTMQSSGIAEVYSGIITNGRMMRVGAFDIHEAAGARVSFRLGLSGGSGTSKDTVKTGGSAGYIFPAHHIGMMTYADKWSESRVMEPVNQFAKQYQGLFLFGAKVPKQRRKLGAVLFGSV
jgi:hypothetical protein